MAGACARTVAVSIIGVVFQLAGLLLFVLGFFPVKPALMGISDFESAMPGCHTSSGEDLPSRPSHVSYQEVSGVPRLYDRLVVMVVDGMPAEFLLGRGGLPPPAEIVAAMPFTQSLLLAGKAFGYHAKAAPPTVTMPRLKAMTSGAIAGFLDVAFNFNTQALLDDNLIGQLARAGWKMVMLGDETWLKLFPNTFMRNDGVSSFYVRLWAFSARCSSKFQALEEVKDTVEVDHNVTRHLEAELAAPDWDLLVLHYLGLDHVGHLGGRSSSLMAPKLKEMDDVIQRIYKKLIGSSSERRTLLMVGSDHGMTDGGNHGGASYQEADALAMFVPGKETARTSNVLGAKQSKHTATPSAWSSFQVDVVPTLALQLGVPIPKNSVGVLLPQLFTSLSSKKQLRALELNAWQLFRLLRVRSPRSSCVNNLCSRQPGVSVSGTSQASQLWGTENDKEIHVFCELFKQAIRLHDSWRQTNCDKPRRSLQSQFQTLMGELMKSVVEAADEVKCGRILCELCSHEEGGISDFEAARDAYLEFLKPASEWLARGTTEKHVPLLVSGGSLMLLSTILLFWVLLSIYQAKSRAMHNDQTDRPHLNRRGSFTLEKIVAVGGVCIHAGSLASSSFVEEEQYTWHFLVCTLSLALLRRTLQLRGSLQPMKTGWSSSQSPVSNAAQDGNGNSSDGLHQLALTKVPSLGTKPVRRDGLVQVLALAGILLGGRLLRAWHCSGVNWTHLPDIAKWLDVVDPEVSTAIRYVALCFVTTISFVLILLPAQRHLLRRLIAFCIFLSSSLVFVYIRSTATGRVSQSETLPTLAARAAFGVLGTTSLLALLLFPWAVPLHLAAANTQKKGDLQEPEKMGADFPVEAGVLLAMQSVGHVFISCWCLLQLLLQQSVNAGPVALLLGQLLLAMVIFFRQKDARYTHWLPVLILQWMGASGHFGLGNSNTLATVDVAGAYIGLSSHSTVLSGLLAFIITYASPFLFMLGMLLLPCPLPTTHTKSSVPQRSGFLEVWLLEAIVVPCILPLALNGVILVAFTAVLTLMQNHLFVWSVFSPKYLYISAATACTTLGALVFAVTAIYSTVVILQRAHRLRPTADIMEPSAKVS